MRYIFFLYFIRCSVFFLLRVEKFYGIFILKILIFTSQFKISLKKITYQFWYSWSAEWIFFLIFLQEPFDTSFDFGVLHFSWSNVLRYRSKIWYTYEVTFSLPKKKLIIPSGTWKQRDDFFFLILQKMYFSRVLIYKFLIFYDQTYWDIGVKFGLHMEFLYVYFDKNTQSLLTLISSDIKFFPIFCQAEFRHELWLWSS